MTAPVAVVTTVSGRHEHLLDQCRALRGGDLRPDQHVVVSMSDPQIRDLLADSPDCTVVELDVTGPLPLARARNIGAAAAIDAGARTLVFLDVDCVPARGLVERYATLAGGQVGHRALLCGQVSYLPLGVRYTEDVDLLAAESSPHPARPRLDADRVLPTLDYSLFWSLSFAVTSRTWRAVGGFCESYRGYGGEDTDFGQRAREAGVGMVWVGGADAYHQYHPVSDPPVEHLDEILMNARTFEARWGWWPMQGWLQAFESAGLIRFDASSEQWTRTSAARIRGS